MWLYQKVLGIPFVYNRIRPLLLGGIDTSAVYRLLAPTADDVVLDVGCGTGVALEYLGEFREYHGFDTDPVAIRAARDRAKDEPRRISFHEGILDRERVLAIRPDVVVLSGLLHHLSDSEVSSLLSDLRASERLRRVTTLDVSFFQGKWLNNALTRLDRGKFPRSPEAYRSLVEAAGFRVEEATAAPSRTGGTSIFYWVMSLVPAEP